MKTFKIKLNDTVTGLANTSWDPTGVVSGRAATEDQVLSASAQLPMIVRSGHTEQTTIAPGARKNFQFDIENLPENYTIASYRQISIAGTNFQTVFIQTFSTTGGGRKANISVFNGGTEQSQISVTATAICVRQLL